jgi:hypothetical protein
MYAQTIEAIANLNTQGGASLVGMMRQERNQARLTLVGIPLDNNIPNSLPNESQKQLISNGVLPNTQPSSLVQNDNGSVVVPTTMGYYNPITDDYVIGTQPVDVGEADVPGSFAGSPYTNIISPELNTLYTSNTLLPGTYTVAEAIDEVVRCNCDCWKLA